MQKMAVGTDAGHIRVYNLKAQNITARYRDRYGYRENLTEVIVQHFLTEQKVRHEEVGELG